MIKFRLKNFTIPEGHYTGPKDMEELPSLLHSIGKATVIGAGVGAIGGSILSSDMLKDTKLAQDTSAVKGALQGGKVGLLAGIGLKLLTNYLHRPMSTVKYQEVDKAIRRQFGIYRIEGITVGDSISKRASIEEKFSFNDRQVTEYKINIAIHNNQVTMYTFGMTKEELDSTSKTLDYYCKKYFGMEYSSTPINAKVNSYSVNITFTNYQVITDFIMELSEVLRTKINLLDNKAIVELKLTWKPDEEIGDDSKNFSEVSSINQYDLAKILAGATIITLKTGLGRKKLRKSLSSGMAQMLEDSIKRVGKEKLSTMGKTALKREDYGNVYLESVLKKLHYIEGKDYTVCEENAPINMSMYLGVFTVVAAEKIEEIEKAVRGLMKSSKVEELTIFSYTIQSRKDFEFLIKKLLSAKVCPNIFDKKGIL